MASSAADIAVQPTSAAPSVRTYPWLFSAPVDLAVFLGSALLSLAALALGGYLGILHADTPGWAWVPAIVLIDVAHVYSTGFRVYFDLDELRRRPLLYAFVPLAGFLIGVALYSEGRVVFWRALAYLAVFHFVRQQYGWVALYHARGREPSGPGKWIDVATIYLATLYPLLYWHCHLPRKFWWFLKGDFTALPTILEQVVAPFYWLALTLYLVRASWLWARGSPNPGKDVVVFTSALCWYLGIVQYNSDYAFTVTNVVIHGIPYLALVYWYRFVRRAAGVSPSRNDAERTSNIEQEGRAAGVSPSSGWYRHLPRLAAFLAILWLLAFVEEMIWDRAVWHDHGWLFGSAWDLDSVKIMLVPLLALPQLTHYLLDGFIWKRRTNPSFTLVAETKG